MKNNSIFTNIFATVVIPLCTFLVILIICAMKDVTFFVSENSYITFFKATASVMLTTFALAINLNSGRFDFSIGAISLFSSIISSSICLEHGYGLMVMLLLSVVFGLILGLFSGIVYILLNLPPIIVSLGITLLYEGAAFAYTSGKGVSFVSKPELTSFPSVLNYALIIVIALTSMIVIFDYTKFGYDYKSLLSGQKVAVNTGVNEKLNAIVCYGLSGTLMGVVGFIAATNTGTIQLALSFGSIGVMFTAFLPMFIGGFIGRYSNEKLGYLLGAVTTALISLAYARLDTSSSVQQVITAATLVLFLIYLNNEDKLKRILSFKRN